MTRTGADAIAWAESRIGPNAMPDAGLCLSFVRQCFDLPAVYGTASDAWFGTSDPHEGDWNPPPAVPCWFWTDNPARHVVFHAGAGRCISTWDDDVREYSSLAQVEAVFGGPYVGWAEDLNRTRIYTPSTTPPEPAPPGPGGGGDTEEDVMLFLAQLDPAVDGRWFLMNYGLGTAHRMWNGLQLDIVRRDPNVQEVHGGQPTTLLQGLVVTGEGAFNRSTNAAGLQDTV